MIDIPAICSVSQERSLHRVARKGTAQERQPRSEPSGGCTDEFALPPKRKAAAQKRKWTESVGAFLWSSTPGLVISRVQRYISDQQPPCFMPALACIRRCEAVVSTCRSLADFTVAHAHRLDRWSWLCHCCVYACLLLNCAMHICKSTVL
jgi:hypothetical protein